MKFIIPVDYVGVRLDIAISEMSGSISRTTIQRLMANGDVFIDGVPVHNPAKKVNSACDVTVVAYVPPEPEYEIVAEDIPLDIVYEDEDLIVINKEAGMVCHPAPGHRSGTLVNALKFHFNGQLSKINNNRPGIVHRLDKGTSGLMLAAKHNRSHEALAAMFANDKEKLIKRQYICFVFGVHREKSGRIETLIARHPRLRQQYTADCTTGRKAVTLFTVEKTRYFTPTKAFSKLVFELLTGRTHQIRVHMQHCGLPVIGDETYGRVKVEPIFPELLRAFQRQALHSSSLSFLHPLSGQKLSFVSALPPDMQLLDELLYAC
ncbi:MAG: RluA family pseudouridine synthase [Holosporales bacterium]|jgi:23S rRNA pseudouridine1911/1915/1917 synthase|nr:RluA family pseudouridine synthase [Holosporales bacterium]